MLLETRTAFPSKKVCKVQFAVGEFDMVVCDENDLTCRIYEIKHSKRIDENQYRHLIDEEKCRETEFRFGRITRKAVLYRGEDTRVNEIDYLNAEEYLRGLHLRRQTASADRRELGLHRRGEVCPPWRLPYHRGQCRLL